MALRLRVMRLLLNINFSGVIEGLHGMRNMTFYDTKYVLHGCGRHACHLWGTVAHSGVFLGNFRESSGKFLDNFSFLENFFNVSLLFL